MSAISPRLVVVDVDRRGDVHRVHEHEPVLDPGLAHERLDAVGDVHVVAPVRRLEGQVLGRVLHESASAEILPELVDVLEPDREPQQPLAGSGRPPSGGGSPSSS